MRLPHKHLAAPKLCIICLYMYIITLGTVPLRGLSPPPRLSSIESAVLSGGDADVLFKLSCEVGYIFIAHIHDDLFD